MIKTRKKRIISCIVLLIVLALLFVVFPSSQMTTTLNEGETLEPGEMLYSPSVLSQDFKTKDNFKGIAFTIGTYMKVLEKGSLKVTVNNNTKSKEVYKKTLDIRTLVDSSFVYLNFDVEKNQDYTLFIELDSITKEHPIALYRSDKNSDLPLIINDEKQKNSLHISYLYLKKSYFNIWYVFLLGTLFYLYFTLIDRTKEEKKDESNNKAL